MGGRKGHFMPGSLLDSQLATLEPLASDEAGVEVSIELTPQQIVDQAVRDLHLS
jgi:gluconokinase